MSHTRRDFLRAALGTSTLMSLGSVAPDWLLRSAAAQPQRDARDTVLVVLQLTGGNDGLNTVVPYADDEYGRNRTTLRLPTSELHKIDSSLGFHPRMEAFSRLYKDGYLSIVQGVGCPNPDQDHDRAMRMWHTADPQQLKRQTGWLGRAVDRAWSPTTPDTAAVFVGPIARPFALNAENVVVPSLRSIEDLSVRSVPAWGERPRSPEDVVRGRTTYEETPRGVTTNAMADNSLLQFVRQSTRDARAKSERIEAAIKAPAARPTIRRSGWPAIFARSPSSSAPTSASASSSRSSAAAASAVSTTMPINWATTAPCCTNWPSRWRLSSMTSSGTSSWIGSS